HWFIYCCGGGSLHSQSLGQTNGDTVRRSSDSRLAWQYKAVSRICRLQNCEHRRSSNTSHSNWLAHWAIAETVCGATVRAYAKQQASRRPHARTGGKLVCASVCSRRALARIFCEGNA